MVLASQTLPGAAFPPSDDLPVVTLIENFDKKYVPALVQSNIDGGKGAGKQVGRQLAGI